MKAIVWGGLLCGILDISAAFVTWGLRGIPPLRILQSIARGLLGPPAFQGGLATAALGLILHFLIAFTAAAVYWAASRRIPALLRHAVPLGALYGVAVFAFMNWVVLPLSAAPTPRFTASSLTIGILTHIFCVGLPIALAVRAGARRTNPMALGQTV